LPYSHAGEIGDIWKHLLLCEYWTWKKPKRYFETNSAFAKYLLPLTPLKEYGVFHLMDNAPADLLSKSRYMDILKNTNTDKNRIYPGSPGQAMMLLRDTAEYFFHDIEEPPLKDILDFSVSLGLQDKITTVSGDSIRSFLDCTYIFNCNDLIFIDPYQPFERNQSGRNFFDIFIKAYISGAKTVLWYGYDNLKNKKAIFDELYMISKKHSSCSIYTYDIWQNCMHYNTCEVNPGVPGCGMAVAHLSEASISKMHEMLHYVEIIYKNVSFGYSRTSIKAGSLII